MFLPTCWNSCKIRFCLCKLKNCTVMCRALQCKKKTCLRVNTQSAPRWVIRESFHHTRVGALSLLHACDPQTLWEEWPGTKPSKAGQMSVWHNLCRESGSGSESKQMGWKIIKHSRSYLKKCLRQKYDACVIYCPLYIYIYNVGQLVGLGN